MKAQGTSCLQLAGQYQWEINSWLREGIVEYLGPNFCWIAFCVALVCTLPTHQASSIHPQGFSYNSRQHSFSRETDKFPVAGRPLVRLDALVPADQTVACVSFSHRQDLWNSLWVMFLLLCAIHFWCAEAIPHATNDHFSLSVSAKWKSLGISKCRIQVVIATLIDFLLAGAICRVWARHMAYTRLRSGRQLAPRFTCGSFT